MKIRLIIFLILVTLFFNFLIYSKEYKVAVVQAAPAETYSQLIKAIAEETNNTVSIQIVPRARGDYLIKNKKVDIFLAVPVFDQKKISQLPYDLSETLVKVCLILASKKDKNITVKDITTGNPKGFKIEVPNPQLANSFPFPMSNSTNYDATLEKIDQGIIDACLMSQANFDSSSKKLGLKSLKKQLYGYYDLRFAIQKGTKNGEVDKMISMGLQKIKSNGKFENIMSKMINQLSVYKNL
jgi:hypothetical protein